ncbi:MAG: ribonuclease Z [Desulfobacteraceae bacterium 4484_190.1]|nr:MAG: ribonuclease Z [Desulfobacteraceae bacterium 4484_190.1]
MKCVLLGSGGMMPMPYRSLISLVIRFQGCLYMFDAGEGVQVGLKKVKLGIKPLRVIAISHLHGDHCLGLPGILMMRAQVPEPGLLTIIGPPGIKRFVLQLKEILGFVLNYPISFIEWDEKAPEIAYEDELVRVIWGTLKHTTFCLGYRFEEHARPGKFRPDSAIALGIPKGPAWGKLQKGENVTLENGACIPAEQVLGKPRPGRNVCYGVDTIANKVLYRLCKDVDIAFLDGMFMPEHQEEATAKGHMTVDDAARVALRAGARKAVLVHISPRYTDEDLNKLTEAAVKRFGAAEIGRDFQSYDIGLRDE